MFSSKYLIRLDDACDSIDYEKWELLTQVLLDYKVKPIVALIPDNKDESLNYCKKKEPERFEDLIKCWKLNNWTFAQHGYNHSYHQICKFKSFHPINNFSEFTGLSLQQQYSNIRNGKLTLETTGIYSNLFVFPGHHFNLNSLRAIIMNDFEIVSDGFFLFPMKFRQLKVLPQQLWWFKKKLLGVWTINLHPNTMTFDEINEFKSILENNHYYKNRMISFEDVEFKSGFLFLTFNIMFYIKSILFHSAKFYVKKFIKG